MINCLSPLGPFVMPIETATRPANIYFQVNTLNDQGCPGQCN